MKVALEELKMVLGKIESDSNALSINLYTDGTYLVINATDKYGYEMDFEISEVGKDDKGHRRPRFKRTEFL